MITTAIAGVVEASRQRVWRALTDPAEIVLWDDARIALVDAPDAYPTAGQTIRWRYKLGSIVLVLKETPQVVQPHQRYALACSAGSLRFEQTFTLVEEPEDSAQPARTRLSLKLTASNRVQLVDSGIDRFEVRQMLTARINETLRSVQKWCEGEDAAR